MNLRRWTTAVCGGVGIAALQFMALPSGQAHAHGWVVTPPSRQELCARGRVANCGPVQFEPQSVEAPKGARSCSGGGAFTVLDDEGRNWPATSVGSSVTITWRKTAAHRTSNWLYYVDGRLHATFDGQMRQPNPSTSHTLSGLPGGRHKILAVWNIGDTVNAFYNCIDVQVGGGGGGGGSPPPTTRPPSTPPSSPPSTPPSGACGQAWSRAAVYTGGMTVSHRGASWKAKWWTQGQEPGTTGEWGVWQQTGTCSARTAALLEGSGEVDPQWPGDDGLNPPGEARPGDEAVGCSMAAVPASVPGAGVWMTAAVLLVRRLRRRRRE